MDTGGPGEPSSPLIHLSTSSASDSDSDYQLQEEQDSDYQLQEEQDDDPEEDIRWGHDARFKKKRTPRARPEGIQGQRCHYCTKKNEDAHVSCSRCSFKYCGICLRIRNGEDIEVEMGQGVRWVCPRCRKGCGPGCKTCCTCVPCRHKNGLDKAGKIINIARAAGFNNVHDYLVHMETGEAASVIARRKLGRGWTKGGDPSLPVDDQDEKIPQWVTKKVRSVRKRLVARSSSQWIDDAYTRGASEVEEERSSPITAVTRNSEKDGLLNSCVGTKVDPKDSRCSQFDGNNTASLLPISRNNKDEDQQCTPVNGKTEMSQIDGLSPSSSLQHRTSGDNKDSSCQISDVPSAADKPNAAGVISSSQDGSGSSSGMQSSEFKRDLELLYQRPYSKKQLVEMWTHFQFGRLVMRYQDGHFEEQHNEEAPLYIEEYPDLGKKLARSDTKPEERLQLLRGFFFWVQNADMDGAYRPPWVIGPNEDEDTDICGEHSKDIDELLAIDFTED